MGAPIPGVYVVGEGKNQLAVAVVVLHRHLGGVFFPLGGDIDDFRMEQLRPLAAVNPLHKGGDTPFVAHGIPHRLRPPQVGKSDAGAAVEEGFLPQAGVEGLIIVVEILEHLRVRLEGDHCPGLCGVPHLLQAGYCIAPLKPLAVEMAVVSHLHLQPFGKGVHHAGAHAMETAGNLVAAAAELAAGMEDGEDHRHRRQPCLLLDTHRDTPAVIGNPDDVPREDIHLNMGAVPRQGFINGVIYNFIDQVMEALGAGRADVHARPLPHRFQPFQYLYLVFAILFHDFIHL